MKIEKISNTDYKLYIYSNKLDEKNLNDDIKLIIKKVQKKLKLKGFYKVIACFKSCGLFLHLIKMEDSFYKNTLDLRIVIEDDLDVYFKTSDYFILKTLNKIKYFENCFYGLVDDSFDELIEKVEFGDFIFGYDVAELLENAIVI